MDKSEIPWDLLDKLERNVTKARLTNGIEVTYKGQDGMYVKTDKGLVYLPEFLVGVRDHQEVGPTDTVS